MRLARPDSAKSRSVWVRVTSVKVANSMPSRQPIDKDRVSRPSDELRVVLRQELRPIMPRGFDRTGVDALQRRGADREVVHAEIVLDCRIHSVAVWQVVIRDAVEARIGGSEVDEVDRTGSRLRPLAQPLQILTPIEIRIDQLLVTARRSARDQVHVREVRSPEVEGGNCS